MNKKILITGIILFFVFVVFNVNEVLGVGIVSQAWTQDVNGDGKADLIYRTYTTPHMNTVKNYHNTISWLPVDNGEWTYTYGGKNYASKWINTDSVASSLPSQSTFKTIGYAFHTHPMGSYPESTDANNKDRIGYNLPGNTLGKWISTISDAYTNSSVKYAIARFGNTYNDVKIYEVIGYNASYSNVSWGTGLIATNLTPNKKIELRYCIVNIGGTNVYIADNVVYADDLSNLVLQAKAKGVGNRFYVSDIIISQTKHPSGGYEVSRSAENFYYKQYNKPSWEWSTSSRGVSVNKAAGSIANLYDNELIVPQTSKRTVLVRHINIGSNTTISNAIIKSSSRISSTELTFKTSNPEQNIAGKNSSDVYTGYEEYYEKVIDIDREVIKKANVDTDKYRCIGHNIAVSTDLGQAEASINNQITNGKFFTNNTAAAAAKTITSDSDYVVIDFYYTEYEKDVYVNHLFIDENGYVKGLINQTIVPNNTAKINGELINRINKDKYISEVYEKKLGYNVDTTKANSISNNNNVEYKGYEIFTTKTETQDLIGTQRTNLNQSESAQLDTTNIQVNYYYYYENKVYVDEPEKSVGGTVFAESDKTAYNKNNKCTDTAEGISVTSIPSGTSAKVGITGVPRYMVGAITTQYVAPNTSEQTLPDLGITLKIGTQSKTLKIGNIKYRVGYYKVTDMAVYKLKNMTIYDADSGHEGTAGKSLFNWKDGNLNLTPNNMNLNVNLKGIRNKKIDSKSIDDINNYVAVSLEDKNGRESNIGTSTSKFTIEYLSEKEFQQVDANRDGEINNSDKEFSDQKIQEYSKILEDKKSIKLQVEENYNKQVENTRSSLADLNQSEEELKRLKTAYIAKDLEKNNKEQEIKKVEFEIYEEKNEKLVQLENAYNKLAQEQTTKRNLLYDAEQELKIVSEQKDKLNKEYNDSINLRNMLKEKANCNDVIDESVYIYLEQEEKESIEQCKVYKEAYSKNIEQQEVEKAKENFENYVNNEFEIANSNKQNAEKEYNITDTNRGNKDNEITSLKRTIYIKEQTLKMMEREYHDFIKNEYIPVKKAFENYRDNTLPIKQEDYNTNVEKESELLNELENAEKEEEIANSNYDTYRNYRINLYNKYNEYKAIYDDYINANIESEQFKLNIYVQNMSVELNGIKLMKSNTESIKRSYDVYDLIKNKKTPEVTTEKPAMEASVYSNIGSTLLKESDFDNSNNIDKTKSNGISVLAGKAEYEANVVIGNKNVNEIEDNVYYSAYSNGEKSIRFKLTTNQLIKNYSLNNKATNYKEKYSQTSPINIYTPITVSQKLESDVNQTINQSVSNDTTNSFVQINTPFTITFGNDKKPGKYNIENTNEFSKGYYIKFDFDVHKVKINGKTYNNGNKVDAGTWIGIIPNTGEGNAKIQAQAYGNIEDNNVGVFAEKNSSYTVRAVAYNASDILLKRSAYFLDKDSMLSDTSDVKDIVNNICEVTSYFAEETVNIVILNRVYDFKVTDVKDINWKTVFRTNTDSTTGAHTGIVYYSGTKKWNTKSKENNNIISRTLSDIGKNPQRTLPIGPYKNTNTSYIKAPKLGYRFSFDMKVTGSYYKIGTKNDKTTITANKDKMITIGTKFYYISNDGKIYLPESDGKKEGIYLFYKTSNGKYVRIGEDGGGYTLKFTPNDGYRYIQDSNTTTLSKTSVEIGNLRKLMLTYNMATVSDNGAVITYYGEYKLPNSTIAVKVNEDGTYDINSPLKDGYVGVVFDIVANGSLSYSKDTKSNSPNTSQWDYEGFLDYTSTGNEVQENNPIKLKLEKGTWIINQSIYNDIKGSVILYDLDDSASTDYE